MKHTFLRITVVLALGVSISTPAHAQFGKLGDAVKKKAKEAVTGKEDPKPAAAPAAAPPAAPQLAISADVLDRFTKGITAEAARRGAYVKREKCAQSSVQGTDYMKMLAAQGEDMSTRIKDNMTDAQKTAEMSKIGQELEVKQHDFVAKKCGPEFPPASTASFETVGSDASGFSVLQYAELKERITAYCEAVARGSDTPANSRIVFTVTETQAMRPRCSGLMSALKKNT